MKSLNAFRKNWEGLSGYIPVIVMLLFAMLTYWLLQITPKASHKETQVQPVHEEDYFMKQFSLKTFEKNGQVKTYIVGNYARHYPDTDSVEIEGPRIYTQSDIKLHRLHKAQGSAQIATSNADASIVELKGNVIFIKEDVQSAGNKPEKTKMSGEYLKINSDVEQISSNQPIEIEKGSQKMYADAMSYDNLDRHLKLVGNVRVIFSKK